MKQNLFEILMPSIAGNSNLREPQRDGFAALEQNINSGERELGIILPVGCGKSGLITLTPFALKAKRALVIAPGLKISDQLLRDFNYSSPAHFYTRCSVLTVSPYPEPCEIRGTSTNLSDLEQADVVITNIHQVQGEENRWLLQLPSDFFDVIIFDEAHHNVADSWDILRAKFPEAQIVNYSATPLRADGQLMSGKFIYTYPVARAIEMGYIKRLKALVLNPKTLRYVRLDDGKEIEINLEEVRRLGEDDSDFRRSILTSQETLDTIVSASLRELNRIRTETADGRHKIIASALNHAHCIQIVQAYVARGYKAAFVHSRENSATNNKIMLQLENHELDVIVQVRKLGEGFDHIYLSVAAVFSVFANLSPFVQFIGRIMRVVDQNQPASLNNQGTVVYHAGANVARLWKDFQVFSQADQSYFDELLPSEQLDFSSSDEIEILPRIAAEPTMEVRSQVDILLEEIPLLEDESVRKAIEYLRSKGLTSEQYQRYEAVLPTRQMERRATQTALSDKVKNAAGSILKTQGLNPGGKSLDKKYLDRTNFEVVITSLNSRINSLLGRKAGERSKLTQEELNTANAAFEQIIEEVTKEVSHVEN